MGAFGRVSVGPRADAMADRLTTAGVTAGMTRDDASRVARLFSLVTLYRSSALDDQQDPDVLHPARTALILMHDAAVADRPTLVAGLVLDSCHPERTPQPELLVEWGEPEAADLLRELPPSTVQDVERVEALVLASRAARLVALAERLDHARHLHLRPPDSWKDFHNDVVHVFLPLAARTDTTLERRFRSWAGRFAERYLPE